MRTITNCRSCSSESLVQIINLGDQHISDFRDDNTLPPKYPLEVVYCDDCKLVQLRHTVPSGEMYHERYGFKSGISDSIKNDLREVVEQALAKKPDASSWLDIASNDGTLLSFVPKEIYRAGVDPITKLCNEARQHADSIVNDFFSSERFGQNDFDIITSISMFYDLDDPNEFVSGVEKVLASKGVWVIQQNYLLTTLQLGAIDNICHEHLEYYTLMSLRALLDRHGLEVFKCSTSMVNGGSIRTFVARKGDYPVGASVHRQMGLERKAGLDSIDAYRSFADKAMSNITALHDLVYELANKDKTIYIYAASTRGATIWQAAGIGPEQVVCAVERNPAKVGARFSAIDIPIISEEEFRRLRPDYALVGPWFFAFPEIINRESEYILGGGKMIVPLPDLVVIERDNINAATT